MLLRLRARLFYLALFTWAPLVPEYGKPMKVVATGGLAPLFSDVTEIIDVVEPDLTLIGLIEISRRNKSR